MKKINIPVVFSCIGLFFFVSFISSIAHDVYMYDVAYRYGSSPLYLYLIFDGIAFLLPGGICFLISSWIGNKSKKACKE